MITPETGIDMSRARYPTSHKGVEDAGLAIKPAESSPPLVWIDGYLTSTEAESFAPNQRINKIPNMHFLCFKSTLFSELNRMRASFSEHFEFYPHTYALPDEIPGLIREHSFVCGRTASAPTWVIKPRNGCCGRGIHFVQTVQEIESVRYPAVAQLLVDPMLLNGKKFDFRFFVLVSSLEPFSVFIYREGIARFCTQNYVPPTKHGLDRPYALLTNTAINKTSDADPNDYTKLASEALRELIARKPSLSHLWDDICKVTMLTLVGIFPSMLAMLPQNGGARAHAKLVEVDGPRITRPRPATASIYRNNPRLYPFIGAPHRRRTVKKNTRMKKKKRGKTGEQSEPSPVAEENEILPPLPKATVDLKDIVLTEAQRYWHILGIDIIIDSKGRPQVLELNDRPSLQVTAPFEKDLKEGLIKEAFLHLSLDGSTFGNHPDSKWQQILPVPASSPLSGPIKAMMQNKSSLKYSGRTTANSLSVQRMVAAGIKPEFHDVYRARFFGSKNEQVSLPPIKDTKEDNREEIM